MTFLQRHYNGRQNEINSDKVTVVREQVEDLKNIMVQNIGLYFKISWFKTWDCIIKHHGHGSKHGIAFSNVMVQIGDCIL